MFWCAAVALIGIAVLAQRQSVPDNEFRALVTIESLDNNQICGTAVWTRFVPINVLVHLTKNNGNIDYNLPRSYQYVVKTDWGIDKSGQIDLPHWQRYDKTITPSVILGKSYPDIEFGKSYHWCYSGYESLLTDPHSIEINTDTPGVVVAGTTYFYGK